MKKIISIIMVIVFGILYFVLEKLDDRIPDNTISVIIKIVCFVGIGILWIFLIGKINRSM